MANYPWKGICTVTHEFHNLDWSQLCVRSILTAGISLLGWNHYIFNWWNLLYLLSCSMTVLNNDFDHVNAWTVSKRSKSIMNIYGIRRFILSKLLLSKASKLLDILFGFWIKYIWHFYTGKNTVRVRLLRDEKIVESDWALSNEHNSSCHATEFHSTLKWQISLLVTFWFTIR